MNWHLYDRELWNERAEGPYIQNVGRKGRGGWVGWVEGFCGGHEIF